MKKFWKIFGITIGSLFGVMLLAILIAVYVVFTPQRLTPIVQGVANEYISCEYEVGEVELTFFSTFPQFGVKLSELYLINPMEGVLSDTLLAVPEMIAKVDLMQLLNNNSLEINELSLYDAQVNIFINSNGEKSFDVFVLPENTADDDTSAFVLPFEEIKIDKIDLNTNKLSYADQKADINFVVTETKIKASAIGLDDIDFNLSAATIDASIAGEQYAMNLPLKVKAENTSLNIDSMTITLRGAKFKISEFETDINGYVALQEDIIVDASANILQWHIPSLLKILPQSISKLLDGIEINDGFLSLQADIKGVYNDSIMPIINTKLHLTDGEAAYKEIFPYKLDRIKLDADAIIDINNKPMSSININNLYAKTKKTDISVKGNISDIFDDLMLNLKADVNIDLPQFKHYLESDNIKTNLEGFAKGNINAKIKLSDLIDLKLERGNISANLNLQNLAVQYDSILLNTSQMEVTLHIPNIKPSKRSANWLSATLHPNDVRFEVIDQINVNMGESTVAIETSNILSGSSLLYSNITLNTTKLDAAMDSMAAKMIAPNLSAYIEYNTKDSTVIPIVNADLCFDNAYGCYTDINATLSKSKIELALSPSHKDASQPKADIMISTQGLKGNISDDIKAQTGKLTLRAQARRNPNKENILLQWNPKLNISLSDGLAELKDFDEKIHIPQITFDYSNKIFNISKSQVILGNSDFSLVGEVRNIGRWIDKKGILEGELTFSSYHTDVNEIMALTSAKYGTEETEEDKQVLSKEEDHNNEQSSPYLVPKDVDIALTTDIKEAVVFDQLARDLGGRLFVKDGVLVLEEMGFICNAAKLQLTAIYKTPKYNHLYVGLDYHMIDVNIQELVNMIPQIDTLLPMLRSFRGGAEFHLAAETFMNENYDLKMSTARGACSITGKDLVLLDGETFSQIAKILMFNKKTENKVDSISVQATLFKNEIDIYPFCLTMDKYMAAAGGRHNTDMSFNYHISLLKPLYLGVDVNGTFDDLKIKPAKCKYAQDFRPIIRRDVETQNASLKKIINQTLKRNVTIE